MTIGQQYPQLPDASIASYSFTDLATAVGYETYYLAVVRTKTQSAAEADRILSPIIIACDTAVKEETTIIAGAGVTRNYDSSTFNLPRTIRGDLIFSTTLEANTNGSPTLNVTFKKVDADSNETTIALFSGGQTLSANTPHTQTIKKATTQTLVKKGEKLRLTIQQIADATDELFAYGSDPLDRNGSQIIVDSTTGASTITKILVPFVPNR